MKLFFDTNVVLDLLAAREPFFRDACLVHSLCARGAHEGIVADFTFCTIAYVLRREKTVEEMRAALRGIHDILSVVPVGPRAIADAIASFRGDFEDEVQLRSALAAGADAILTRDKAGFSHAPIPVMTPTEFLGSASPSR